MFVGLNAGGITFRDHTKTEQVLRIGTASFSSNRDMNGVQFSMPQYSDFIRFAHINKADIENGWSSSDTQYPFFDLWSGSNTVGGTNYKKGITTYAPLYAKGGINLPSANDAYPSILNGNLTWNGISGLLGLVGDNGGFLGYQNGSELKARIVVTEGAHQGTGDQIRSWGNWNCSGHTVHNATFSGKHVNSYANTTTRTVSNTAGVMAEGNQVRVNFENIQIKDGKAILNIPKRYRGINEGYIIASIVKKGRGDVWVSEEEEERFIIEAENDIKINIEIIIKLTEAVVARTLKYEDSICYEVPNKLPEECCY